MQKTRDAPSWEPYAVRARPHGYVVDRVGYRQPVLTGSRAVERRCMHRLPGGPHTLRLAPRRYVRGGLAVKRHAAYSSDRKLPETRWDGALSGRTDAPADRTSAAHG